MILRHMGIGVWVSNNVSRYAMHATFRWTRLIWVRVSGDYSKAMQPVVDAAQISAVILRKYFSA